MTLLGILAFVVALLVSVVLHEAGHFVTARRYGMKATQFFAGFGPTLWSFRRGETEYGVKAIPAGGFVKIVGMTPLEEVEPEDEPRAFYRQPAGRKAVVLSAGSIVHFIIAVLLVLLATAAFPSVDDDAPVVSAPVAAVPSSITADGASEQTVPAPANGVLREGDRVLSVAGQSTRTWRDVVEIVRDRPGQALPFVVERGDQRVDVTITPVQVTRPSLDDSKRSETVGAIGVGQDLVLTRLGPVEAVKTSGERLKLMVTGTWTAATEKLGTITKLYSPDRDREGLVGVVGAARVSGEVLGTQEIPFVLRVSDFLLLIAGLNLFVGVFNLLPLLPLDGGHIAVLAYENARDKLRRLRGYTGEFQRVDFTKLMPLTYAVVLLFVGLTLWIMGADIVNPIRLTQ